MTTEPPIPSYLAGFSERSTAWRSLLPEGHWTFSIANMVRWLMWTKMSTIYINRIDENQKNWHRQMTLVAVSLIQ
jgi:hypothetical protein